MKRFVITICLLVFASPVLADCIFREDTASQTFLVGPFLDKTDGSPEVSLTVANTAIRVSKNGANTIAKNSGSCTHDEVGMYQCTFDATDTNTAGMLQIFTDDLVDSTDIIPVFHECLVLAAEYFDLLDGTTSIMTSRQAGNLLETTITTATSQTELDLAAGASNDDAYNNMTATFVGGTEECERRITDYTGTGAILFLESACPFTLASADTVRVHVGAAGKAVEDVDAAIAALNDISPAEVNAEADTALVDVNLDHVMVSDTKMTGDIIDATVLAANTIGPSEIATDAIDADALAADASAEIWAVSCEDQGGAYSCRETMSLLLSEAMGTCVYTAGTRTWVCKDPSGTETRFTIVYGSGLDGTRTTSTPAPMTP